MKDRSLFWPFVFIATGFLWMMVNMGKLPQENLWALTQVWPYLLMAIGVGLILRSIWRPAGMIFSGLIVVGAVLAILYAPQLGWNKPQDWGISHFNVGSDFGGGVTGSGVITTEKREVASFTRIDLRYPAIITIKQGEKDAVTLETDDNLIKQLTTKVNGGVLVIDNNESLWSQRVNPSDKVLITITVKDLSEVDFPSAGEVSIEGIQSENLKLTVSGAGSISLLEVDLGKLEIQLSGAGSINAAGVAENLKLGIPGAGSFNGTDLKVNQADVNISGVGSAEIWVLNELTANLSGIGSISYYGNPATIQKNVSGLGKVNSLGTK
jgi:hypothetical protein